MNEFGSDTILQVLFADKMTHGLWRASTTTEYRWQARYFHEFGNHLVSNVDDYISENGKCWKKDEDIVVKIQGYFEQRVRFITPITIDSSMELIQRKFDVQSESLLTKPIHSLRVSVNGKRLRLQNTIYKNQNFYFPKVSLRSPMSLYFGILRDECFLDVLHIPNNVIMESNQFLRCFIPVRNLSEFTNTQL